jgi:hypothetical protein
MIITMWLGNNSGNRQGYYQSSHQYDCKETTNRPVPLPVSQSQCSSILVSVLGAFEFANHKRCQEKPWQVIARMEVSAA